MTTPFLGPTYDLLSRPASVQRTINMMPVPLEPGNERTGYVFKDVPGLTSFSSPAPAPVSQKIYWEVLVQAESSSASSPDYYVGVANSAFDAAHGNASGGGFWASPIVPSAGHVLMFAVDFSSGKMWCGDNGSWVGVGSDPVTGTAATYSGLPPSVAPQITYGIGLPSATHVLRCTSASFSYTAPSGFTAASASAVAWNAANKSSFWTISGTGNTTASISGVNSGFPPPWQGVQSATFFPS